MVRRLSLSLLVALALLGCRGGRSPELRVIGVHEELRHEVVFVQVTNPASRSMRLTRLEYKFAAGSATIDEGELEIHRDVPAGATVVVEVPVDSVLDTAVTLHGKLTAELDQIVRIFKVSAEVNPTVRQRPDEE